MKSGKKNLRGKIAITYFRVSTKEQGETGHSLNSQRQQLRNFCRKNEISIEREFQEEFSAKNFNRPEYLKLKKYAKINRKKIDYLLCVNWDRFGRNMEESILEMKFFKDLEIEINFIDSWFDSSDPYNILIKAFNLAMPEIDNEIRSNKIKAGIKQANREGRYISKPPIGFIKGRDEFNKPLMKPCLILSPIIKILFDEFSNGYISQNQILKDKRFEKLGLSRSNLSRLLRNVVYAGKLRIKEEGREYFIDALHKNIISMKTFEKTKNQLLKRSRFKQKPKKFNNKLPLRGHLKCSKCGGNLTGSGSRGKSGIKYYYYHCDSRKCKERFRADLAHKKLINYLSKFNFSNDVKNLFIDVLKEQFISNEKTRFNQIETLENEINNIKNNSELLLDKLIEGIIENDTYEKRKKTYDDMIDMKKAEVSELNDFNDDMNDFIDFSVNVSSNLDKFISMCDYETVNEFMSSIFDEKLEFNDKNYRTPKLNSSISSIYHEINELELRNKKTGNIINNDSRLVLGAGLEPARTLLLIGF